MKARRKHRATGRPAGRPSKLSSELRAHILDVLRKRAHPDTGLVRPHWKSLEREFGISHSSLARLMGQWHKDGVIETVTNAADSNDTTVYYRLKG